MEKVENKLLINLNNLDDITQNSLTFFFNRGLFDRAEIRSINSEINVYIIDIDRKFDKNIIPDLKGNNQFAIILHNAQTSPLQEENVFNVIKPVKPDNLKQQIGFIEKRLQEEQNNTDKIIMPDNGTLKVKNVNKPTKEVIPNTKSIKPLNNHLNIAVKRSTQTDSLNQYKAHKHVGSNKDINLENSEELKKIYHTPNKYLYYYLSKAVKQGRTNKADVRIKTLFGSLLYEYETELIYHDYNKSKIKYLKSSPLFGSTQVSLIKINSAAKAIKQTTQDADNLIWDSAILASKGKIPLGTSLTQTVEMKAWPNFTRLLVFRYMIQISAAWSTHHLSLLETASQLKIPQRYIFTLYNAMLALGSAKINNVINNDKRINIKKSKSVFSKILSHIFNK